MTYQYAGCLYQTQAAAVRACIMDWIAACGDNAHEDYMAYIEENEAAEIYSDMMDEGWRLPDADVMTHDEAIDYVEEVRTIALTDGTL